MADREYIVTFDGEKARVRLIPKDHQSVPHPPQTLPTNPPGHYIFAPSAARAEQIARAMRKK